MSVEAETARFSYVGDGVSTAFPFPARFLSNSDIIVAIDGVVQASGVVVSGAGNNSGGQVTFAIAPPVGVSVVLLRAPPLSQLIDFVNGQTVMEQTLDDGLDKLTMILQYLKDQLGRSIRLPELSPETGDDLILPLAADRAGKALVFDSNGALTVSVDDYEDQAANAAASAAAAEAARQAAADILAVVTGVSGLLEVPTADPAAAAVALALGFAVLVPATTTSYSPNTSQAQAILKAATRVRFLASSVTFNLPAGIADTTTGDIAEIGQWHNVKIVGAAPIALTMTTVASVTGTPGAWSVTYNVAENPVSLGIVAGHYLKNFQIAPIPILFGDDNVTLRRRALPNELAALSPVLGLATAPVGSGGIAFSNIDTGGGSNLATYVQPGDFFFVKGQQREVLTAPGGGSTATISGAWEKDTANTEAYFLLRQNTGGCSTSGLSTTVQFNAGVAATEMNVGDVIFAAEQVAVIQSIVNSNTITVAPAMNLGAGPIKYAIMTAGCLHDGAHEVLSVTSSTVTVRNKNRLRPPVNRVVGTGSSVRVLRTVLKQTGPGDGIKFAQGGGLAYLDAVAVVCPAQTGIGVALSGRVPALPLSNAGTSYGDFTQHGYRADAVLGPDFAVAGWSYGAVVGFGCTLNARMAAFSGPGFVGLWGLEGAIINARRARFTGGVYNVLINANSTFLITEANFVGATGDALRLAGEGASVYGEAPSFWGAGGMNVRATGRGGVHITQGVSGLSAGSGFRFEHGEGEISRMVVVGNSREGIEGVGGSDIEAAEVWVCGSTALTGNGRAISISGQGAAVRADGSGLRANPGGLEALDGATVKVGSNSLLAATLSGVQRLNERSATGSVVLDGTATGFNATLETGTWTPTIAAQSGAPVVTGAQGWWEKNGRRIRGDITFTVTNVNSATGYITASLPFAAARVGAASGGNTSNGIAGFAYVSGSQVFLYKFDGTTALAVSTFKISFDYEF